MTTADRLKCAGAGGRRSHPLGDRTEGGRRAWAPRLAAIAFALAALCLITAASASAAAPNVLFIITDDQAIETMNIAGAMDPMPKTKEWFYSGGTSEHGPFEGGTSFRHAVASTPLCCPARASFLTGRFAHNHGVKTVQDSPGPPLTHVPTGGSALDTSTTLARYLNDAGYHTGIFGKYLNQWDLDRKPDDPYDNWDEWAIFDNPGVLPGYEVNHNGNRRYEFRYEVDAVRDRALDFVRRAKTERDDVPWFLYLAPSAPHAPFAPPPRHADAPAPALDRSDPAYMEADRRDKPPWTRTSLLDAELPEGGWADHLRMLRSVDEMVDALMTELQAQGREDRETIAFFVSDNGFLWGEHGLWGKNLPYAESVQIPYMLRWPAGAVASNHASDRLVADVDLAPTVVDAVNDALGGEAIPPNPAAPMDGLSLVDPAQPERDVILTEAWGMGPPEGTRGYCFGVSPSWAALRTPRFSYIEHYATRPIPPPGQSTPPPGCSAREYETRSDEPPTFKEYYDTRPGYDPEEISNLLADDNVAPDGTEAQFSRLVDDGEPENDPPTTYLHNRLAQLRGCSGETCRPQSGAPAAPPVEVAITKRPPHPSGFRDVSFSLTATEPGAKFRCALDNGPSRPCRSPVRYAKLPNGRHRFRVVGSANGSSQTKSHLWVVDRDLPDVAITAKPRKSDTGNAAVFEFTGSEAVASFTCALDGQPPVACSSPHEYEGLIDGEHTFTLSAQGAAGPDATPRAFTWRVDTRGPDTQIARSETFSTYSSGASFSFSRTFAGADAGTGAPPDPGLLGRYDCRLDGGAWKSCDTSKTLLRLPGGEHQLEVKATDVAGNEDFSPARDAWQLGPVQAFSDQPDTRWPEISAGTEVSDVVPDGAGGWYVGGDFTMVRDATGEHPHTDLVHITSAMTVDNSWNPSTNGKVRSIVLSPDGMTLYVGGTFTAVGPNAASQSTARGRMAAFSTATGTPTTWNPDASQEVTRLALPPPVFGVSPTTVYAAGLFQRLKNSAGAQAITRRKVAEIPLAGDGTPTSWNPNVNSGATLMALAVNERYVYVGGAMESVGGSPSAHPLVTRTNLAELDRLDGKATGWAPDPDGAVFTLHPTVRDEALDTILAGGAFTHVGNPPAARVHAAEINLSDEGSVTGWDPSLASTGGGGSVRAFMSFACDVSLSTVPEPPCASLVGGAFDSVRENATAHIPRDRLTQVARETGFAHDWSPAPDAAPLAFACRLPTALAVQRCDNSPSRVLAVGGLFTEVGGVPRGRLAFFGAP